MLMPTRSPARHITISTPKARRFGASKESLQRNVRVAARISRQTSVYSLLGGQLSGVVVRSKTVSCHRMLDRFRCQAHQKKQVSPTRRIGKIGDVKESRARARFQKRVRAPSWADNRTISYVSCPTQSMTSRTIT